MADLVDEATLADAMSAPTDYGTLVRAIAEVGAAGNAVAELDPAGVDLAAEITHREEIERRAGGSLTADAVGRLLGISRQAVDKRRRAGTLLAIRQGGNWAYPRAQFHENGTIPCLAEVLQGFEVSGPWVTLEFLVTEDSTLDGLTPRDSLLKNDDMRGQVMTLVRGQRDGEGFA
jgi:hypothetical protein